MFVYLVQHADAKREEEDPARPLSEKGLQDIIKVASYASLLNIAVDKIFHSKKLRAKQTADVLFQTLKPLKGTIEIDGLSPMDDPVTWADRLKDLQNNVMLVGHLPNMARLASLLLTGNPDKNIVSFRMAGIVCLKRDENSLWSLQWMLTPDVVVGEKGVCDSL
jgi:phosphohistidine phosphatase